MKKKKTDSGPVNIDEATLDGLTNINLTERQFQSLTGSEAMMLNKIVTAGIAMIEYKQLLNEIVNVNDVAPLFANIAATITTKMLKLPSIVIPKTDGKSYKEQHNIWSEHIVNALAQLSTDIESDILEGVADRKSKKKHKSLKKVKVQRNKRKL